MYHSTPDGSYPSEESKLRVKFNKGTITKEELRRLASFTTVKKKKETVTEAKIFGAWTSIEKLGISIELLKQENVELR